MSHSFTTWMSITSYKQLEYLVSIQLMLFEQILVVINVHFMVFKHNIFLVTATGLEPTTTYFINENSGQFG